MFNPKNDIVFGFFTRPKYTTQTLMLVRSLRQFGEELANIPIWILVPENEPLSPSLHLILEDLGVDTFPFHIDEAFSHFPFAAKAVAAAKAEELANGKCKILAWHDRTGVILHAPRAFNLPEDKKIGFRPTDIANIGASYGGDLPAFWQTLCNHFSLIIDQFPRIRTAVDQQDLHLYVNAGLLVVRPGLKILGKWSENLYETFALEKFTNFYHQDPRYAIFMHQAGLTAAIIQQTDLKDRVILPDNYLFSVDNFFDYPQTIRPNTLDEIVTGRFHEFFSKNNWIDLINASNGLMDWFKRQLQHGPYWPA